MKKTVLSFLFLVAVNTASAQGQHVLHAFYFFNVTNPAGVVAAMDEFKSSSCGSELPADVGLMAETINGSASSTHFLIVSYETMADFSEAQELTQTCADAATFLQEMRSAATPVTEYAIIPAIEVGDWTQDSVFMKFDMKVNNAELFAASWSELMDANVQSGVISDSYGLNRILLGNSEASHFVYIGAQDFESLVELDAKVRGSSAFEEYQSEVGDVRELLNTSLITPVMSWPKN
ncbi:MAG: hypothetical protein CMQ07_08755 [Gammaproteobacteria bacterium]|nr:hypothetical protein [Gammaproteobacteria bacterium]